jgi:hypothetical protein
VYNDTSALSLEFFSFNDWAERWLRRARCNVACYVAIRSGQRWLRRGSHDSSAFGGLRTCPIAPRNLYNPTPTMHNHMQFSDRNTTHTQRRNCHGHRAGFRCPRVCAMKGCVDWNRRGWLPSSLAWQSSKSKVDMVDHMILHRNEASQVAFESIRSIQVARAGLGASTLGLFVRSFVRSFVR